MAAVGTSTNTALADAEATKVKCVVWDLDNTCWSGILLEDRHVTLRPGIVDIIRALDERGILQSVASRNEWNDAWNQLVGFGIAEYFLYPQIGMQPKSASIRKIAESLNIGMDTILFVDDDVYEREEVKFSLPEIRTLDAACTGEMLAMPELMPRFITTDSRNRRKLYLGDIQRKTEETSFQGTNEEFLKSLDMVMVIRKAGLQDLHRAEELTIRTNQLNATGETYSYEELKRLLASERHLLLVAELKDRFGSYGTIGLALVELGTEAWEIRLLLMSCRVMTRGVGSVMLNCIIERAVRKGKRVRARFIPTDKNRTMHITYRFAGFDEVEVRDGVQLLERQDDDCPALPAHLAVVCEF